MRIRPPSILSRPAIHLRAVVLPLPPSQERPETPLLHREVDPVYGDHLSKLFQKAFDLDVDSVAHRQSSISRDPRIFLNKKTEMRMIPVSIIAKAAVSESKRSSRIYRRAKPVTSFPGLTRRIDVLISCRR
jgi:hypothetical protein